MKKCYRLSILLLCAVLVLSLFAGGPTVRAEGEAKQPFMTQEAMDKDYAAFWDIYMNSYPFHGVAARRGADIERIREQFKPDAAKLENPESYALHYQNMIDYLSSHDVLGHLGVIAPGIEYEYYYNQECAFAYGYADDDPWVAAFEDKHAKGFYGWKHRPDISEVEDTLQPQENNVYWEINKDKDYALISVETFDYANIKADQPEIERFYDAAQEVDNLVIDVRGNPGGLVQYWLSLFVQPNITEPLEVELWGTYKASPYTEKYEREIEENWISPLIAGSNDQADGREDLDEDEFPGIINYFEKRDPNNLPGTMTKLKAEDVADMDRAFSEMLRVEPKGDSKRFSGKIWVLIDDNSYSAAETFAYFCKATGFASLVGRPSGGDGVCCVPIYVNLPESGMIMRYSLAYGLNPDGTCNEEVGTQPDVLTTSSYAARKGVEKAIEDDKFAMARLRTVADLTLEQKESDYDRFWDILETSYPMYDYLIRHGAHPDELKADRRGDLAGITDNRMWYEFFREIVEELEGDLGMTGHLGPIPAGQRLFEADYQTFAYMQEHTPDDPWTSMQREVFTNPHVLGYYDLKKEDVPQDEPPLLIIPNNVQTSFHPEEDYAYLYIATFINQDPKDGPMIKEFFEQAEAQGIKNVVIDIRGNQGGYNNYWLMNIVSPNITEPLEVENIGLYKRSEYNKEYVDYYTASTYEEDFEKIRKEGKLPTLIFSWNRRDRHPLPPMPKLVESDVEHLDGAFLETIRIDKSYDKPLYSGKFWILSDPVSYSASEYFISFAKRTGFASIVGQESAGDGSCVVTIYNDLPESGLVIRYNALYGLNPDGSCSEEHATAPDFEVKEDEDALQYCLDLIKAQKPALPGEQ